MFDVIIVANGRSVRAGMDKLSADINNVTTLDRSIDCFLGIDGIAKIIVVTDRPLERTDVIVTDGGATRTQSVKRGLALTDSEYVLIHDGARPFVTKSLIRRVMADATKFGSAIPYTRCTDTLCLADGENIEQRLNRESYVLLQTPQGFNLSQLKSAYLSSDGAVFNDDSEAYGTFIAPPHLVLGENSNKKITYYEDLVNINAKVGSGYDVHRFCKNKRLVLGGVLIDCPYGMEAHSDGDVVIHALMDALLASVNERDIGVLFPDNDPKYANIDSAKLLTEVAFILNNHNASVVNISLTIMAQAPRLCPYIPAMKKRLGEILSLNSDLISISATTTENLGIIGKGEGIACIALVSVI